MSIPRFSGEITREWMEFVLIKYEGLAPDNPSLKIKSMDLNKSIGPEDSFNSEITRASIIYEYIPHGEKESREKVLKIFVKFLNLDPLNRFNVLSTKFYSRELTIYSKLMKELHEFEETHVGTKQLGICIPKLIYTESTEAKFIIILEDVTEQGFCINPKDKSLTYEMACEAIKQIAYLHALSSAYNEKINIQQKYPEFIFNSRPGIFFGEIFKVCFANLIKFLENEQYNDNVIQKLKNIQKNSLEVYDQLWNDHKTSTVRCLIHGDYWNNNLMFSNTNSQNSNKIGVKIIDWQMCHWGNPLLDLHYLIYSSTSLELRDKYLETFLELYHSTFTGILHKLNSDFSGWSYLNFRKEFNHFDFMGFVYGITLPQIFLSESAIKISGASIILPNAVEFKMKTFLTKIFLPFVDSIPMRLMFRYKLKQLLGGISKELIEGKNTSLNNRMTDIIKEAEAKGLFDKILTQM